MEWGATKETLLAFLGVASLLMFAGSLLAIPWLVTRIPADYFLRHQHYVDRWKPRHPVLRLVVLTLKNLLGVALVMAGLAMLLLPGQGVLTMVVGLFFLDFPGKLALERWCVRRRGVHQAINWIRRKANRPPLMLPPRERAASRSVTTADRYGDTEDTE